MFETTFSEKLLIIIKAFGLNQKSCVNPREITDAYILLNDLLGENINDVEIISSREIVIPVIDGALALLSKIGFISRNKCGFALEEKGEVFLSGRLSSKEKIDILKMCVNIAKLPETKRHLYALLIILKNKRSLGIPRDNLDKLEEAYYKLKTSIKKNLLG